MTWCSAPSPRRCACYLLEHDALVADVLVIEPVNLRLPGAALPAGLGNKFGLVFVALPTGEPDPARRRALIRAQMEQIKHSRGERRSSTPCWS